MEENVKNSAVSQSNLPDIVNNGPQTGLATNQGRSDKPADRTAQSTGAGIGGQVNQKGDSKQVTSKPGKGASFETGMERSYYKNFINPMLSEMEKHVRKNEDMLDQINKQFDDDRKAREKARLSAHIPEPLKGNGQKIEDILHSVEEMVIYENFDEEDSAKRIEAKIQRLDDHGHAAVMAHSIAAHIGTLDIPHLKKLASKVSADCELWLTRLFRFGEGSVLYHEDKLEGLVKICRLALHQKYTKYANEGFEALYSRPPVIYISAAAMPGLGHSLCAQLGLPMSCLCTVPCNTMFGSKHVMDVSVLEKLIQDDIAAAKTPMLLIAYAGTPVVGHVDNLDRLQEICKKSAIWLHIEGNHLATLTMYSVPTNVAPARSGDSITVSPGLWLGVPGIPHATIYKKADPGLAHSIRLSSFNPHIKLNCLPLWVCLQSHGHEGIVDRIKKSCNLAKHMFEKLSEIPNIRQVSRDKHEKKKDDSKEDNFSVKNLISKAINALLVFEIECPTVVFRYTEPVDEPGTNIAPYSSLPDDEANAEKRQIYLDTLNTWLYEVLISEKPRIAIQLVDVEREGVAIRFAPLESAHVFGSTDDDIVSFVDCVKTQVEILDATIRQQKNFQEIVHRQENLQPIEILNWAGLGVLQYTPTAYLGLDKASLTDSVRKDINGINIELVHRLKMTDPAFSLGEDTSGLYCVRFGLITNDTDVEEYIAMVYTLGREIEESSKYLEEMSEVIRTSIEETNKELEKENLDRLRQEGLLRHMPIVGSLLNWWSPIKDSSIRGRMFNMNSGKLESTEKVYKYHIQIQENGKKAAPPASPTSPTSYKENLKAASSPRGSDSSPRTSSSSPLGGATSPHGRVPSPHLSTSPQNSSPSPGKSGPLSISLVSTPPLSPVQNSTDSQDITQIKKSLKQAKQVAGQHG